MQTIMAPSEPSAPAPVPSSSAAATPGVVRSQPFPLPILLCGLGTTALTLIGVFLLDRFAPDVNIMGWYANKILPAGAILVGIAASCGYGIAAWYSGLKMSNRMMWLILGLQACAYFAAQYIDFAGMHLTHRDSAKPVSFWEYYDLVARSFAWQQHNGTAGEPLGVFGYFFRALEVIGFSAGGLIVPAAMRANPYCEKCLRYKRTKQLAWVPASIKLKKFGKKDVAASDAQTVELDRAMLVGQQRMQAMQAMAAEGKVAAFSAEVDVLKPDQRKTTLLPVRYVFDMVFCPCCRAGELKSAMLVGSANQMKRTEVATTPVSEDFVLLLRNK